MRPVHPDLGPEDSSVPGEPWPRCGLVAGDGVRYRQWHTTALCSPTRSCLPTGCNNTRHSMAYITEGDSGFANASGTIPRENGMPGGYMLAGEALDISLDVGDPVTQDSRRTAQPHHGGNVSTLCCVEVEALIRVSQTSRARAPSSAALRIRAAR